MKSKLISNPSIPSGANEMAASVFTRARSVRPLDARVTYRANDGSIHVLGGGNATARLEAQFAFPSSQTGVGGVTLPFYLDFRIHVVHCLPSHTIQCRLAGSDVHGSGVRAMTATAADKGSIITWSTPLPVETARQAGPITLYVEVKPKYATQERPEQRRYARGKLCVAMLLFEVGRKIHETSPEKTAAPLPLPVQEEKRDVAGRENGAATSLSSLSSLTSPSSLSSLTSPSFLTSPSSLSSSASPPSLSQDDVEERPLRILMLPDSQGWAFDNIASQVRTMCAQRCSPSVQVDLHTAYWPEFLARFAADHPHVYCKTAREGYSLPAFDRLDDFDAVVCMWYGFASLIFSLFPARTRRMLCVYDYVYWPEDSPLAVASYRQQLTEAVRSAHLVLYACPAVRDRLVDLMAPLHLRPEPTLMPCVDGVDTCMFQPLPLVDSPDDDEQPLRVGWAGNSGSKEKDLKGLQLIRQAALRADGWIELVLQDAQTKRCRHEEMPAFYGRIDVYVCMSLAEGTPNPVLEAAASQRPFVSTRVGVVPMLVDDAQRLLGADTAGPGIVLRERSVDALYDALWVLHTDRPRLRAMSRVARIVIEQGRWSWDEKIEQFADAFCQCSETRR